jgi:hypothetical protein
MKLKPVLTVQEEEYVVGLKDCQRCGEPVMFRRPCSKCGRWVCLECFDMVKVKDGDRVKCKGACQGELVDVKTVTISKQGKLGTRTSKATKQGSYRKSAARR